MTDWLDDIPDAVAEALVVPRGSDPVARTGETKTDALRRIEDKILSESMEIVQGVLAFADVDPEKATEGPPRELVERYGAVQAGKLFRLALYGCASKKTAPVGIEVARTIMLGIVKARATEKVMRDLNVQVVVNVSSQQYRYDEIEDTDSQ